MHSAAIIPIIIFLSGNMFAGTSSWVEDIFGQVGGDVALNQIAIPGTHDSATDLMTIDSPLSSAQPKIASFIPGVVLRWGLTQDQSVGEQLRGGVRYLDIRAEHHEGKWMTFHGLISNPLPEVLAEIGEFATKHPKEIIIVDFQHILGQTKTLPSLVKMILNNDSLSKRLAGKNELSVSSNLVDFWQRDKNVILLMTRLQDLSDESEYLWPRTIENPWSNTRHTTKVIDDLTKQIVNRNTDLLYVSQAVLTADPLMMLTGWMRGVPSLKDMAVKWMNPELPSLIPKIAKRALDVGKNMNIVIVDFYQHSKIVPLCLDINQKLAASHQQGH